MPLDPGYAGKAYPPAPPYLVGREKIRHFAGGQRLPDHAHRHGGRGRRAGRDGVADVRGTGGMMDLPARTFRITRTDLVRYAGASGDYNPIHWSDRVATSVGLPGVIAHGMYTMALVARAVTGWVGDPAAIVEYRVRF